MVDTVFNKHAFNQINYYVEDVEKACLAHSALFGSGPFLWMDPEATTGIIQYQGKDQELVMQTAYGQYGNMQIEMVSVLSEVNPYKELGRYGVHHFSNWVDDFEAAEKVMADNGFKPLFKMTSGAGMKIAYYDTKDVWGHYVEFHQPVEGMWNFVQQASIDWDGANPYRKFGT